MTTLSSVNIHYKDDEDPLASKVDTIRTEQVHFGILRLGPASIIIQTADEAYTLLHYVELLAQRMREEGL